MLVPPEVDMALPLAAITILLVLGGILAIMQLSHDCYDSLKVKASKDKLNPARWFKSKYRFYVANQVLPTLQPKEKESPIVGPDPVSPALPKCPKLDGAEKGKNLMFRFRSPTMMPESELEITTNETKITITSLPV